MGAIQLRSRHYLIAATAGAATSLTVVLIARAGLQLLTRRDPLDVAFVETGGLTRKNHR